MTTDNRQAAPYVFLSYASVDREKALRVADLLESHVVSVWVDRKSIIGGSSWSAEIVDAIKGCAVLAVLISEASARSRNVQQEMQLAWEHDRKVLPLLLEKTDLPSAMEYALAGRQRIEVFDQTTDEWVTSVLRALAGFGVVVPNRSLSDVSTTQPSVPPVAVADPPDAPTAHLPAQQTGFIGRVEEVAAVRRLVLQPDVRLVTLTGPGGVGKTRLSIEVATSMLDAFPDGAYFIPLDAVTDPTAVGSAIAEALDVREGTTRTLVESVSWYLRAKRCLLVLDNFEHVTDAAPVVGQLLAGCPAVKALVTSRSPLGAYGEREFPVEPLSVPDGNRTVLLDQVGHNDAVHLFVERARAVKPDFALTSDNAGAIVQICRRLDGLPLAIELAAARVRLFPPQALLARLESRLNLLTGGAKDRSARQQTLRGALTWSYDLLDDEEKALFRRLAVFVGGCTLAAVEAVTSTQHPEPSASVDVLGGIETLVEHSLLRQTELAGEPRFVMLETTREYALEQLAIHDELDATRDRHAAHFLALGEALIRDLFQGGDLAPYYAGVLPEMANLRATLRWYYERKLAEAGLRVFAALHIVWEYVGPRGEGWVWCERFLALAETQSVAPEVHRNALYGAGTLARWLGDLDLSQRLLQQSIDLAELANDTYRVSAGLSELGTLLLDRNDLAQAQVALERSLTVAQEGRNAGTPAQAIAVARALILLGDLGARSESSRASRRSRRSRSPATTANAPRGSSQRSTWRFKTLAECCTLAIASSTRRPWPRFRSLCRTTCSRRPSSWVGR